LAFDRGFHRLLAGNLGDDADSTGALCGQFAGAIYI
jgi:ADP-ribosylglycohydrolase